MSKNLLPLREAVKSVLGMLPLRCDALSLDQDRPTWTVLRSQMFYGRRCSTVADVQTIRQRCEAGRIEMTSYLPLVEAVRAATGRKVHLSTVLRWCSRGARGRVLSSWMVGGRRMTTVEAVNAFIAAASEPEHLLEFALEPLLREQQKL